jgi:Tetratricopeptide repeat
MFSPALSVSSIIRSQSSTFAGQSPAPIYRPLPSLFLGSLPAPSAFQGQSASVQPYLPGSALPLEIGHPATGSVWYRYKQADEERLREELSRTEIVFGISHSETLGILSKLGAVLIVQGRYKSAEEVIRRLVEGRRIVNGNDDVNTLDALDLLGQVLGRQGLYTKAEKIHQRTLESRKAILGEEDLCTLTSMADLASTFLESRAVEGGRRARGTSDGDEK